MRIISKILSVLSFKKISKEKLEFNNSNLSLIVGYIENEIPVVVPENGLYQNFLITGTIGSGKTSSAMYPFTKQLMEYNSSNPEDKIGMLILDVKGNYYTQVESFAKELRTFIRFNSNWFV